MRLIDADKCISEIKNNIHFYGHEHVREGLQRAIGFINHTPTVDPVKHGRWITHACYELTSYESCSCCDDYLPSCFYGNTLPKYCPNCGAKMDA